MDATTIPAREYYKLKEILLIIMKFDEKEFIKHTIRYRPDWKYVVYIEGKYICLNYNPDNPSNILDVVTYSDTMNGYRVITCENDKSIYILNTDNHISDYKYEENERKKRTDNYEKKIIDLEEENNRLKNTCIDKIKMYDETSKKEITELNTQFKNAQMINMELDKKYNDVFNKLQMAICEIDELKKKLKELEKDNSIVTKAHLDDVTNNNRLILKNNELLKNDTTNRAQILMREEQIKKLEKENSILTEEHLKDMENNKKIVLENHEVVIKLKEELKELENDNKAHLDDISNKNERLNKLWGLVQAMKEGK